MNTFVIREARGARREADKSGMSWFELMTNIFEKASDEIIASRFHWRQWGLSLPLRGAHLEWTHSSVALMCLLCVRWNCCSFQLLFIFGWNYAIQKNSICVANEKIGGNARSIRKLLYRWVRFLTLRSNHWEDYISKSILRIGWKKSVFAQ